MEKIPVSIYCLFFNQLCRSFNRGSSNFYPVRIHWRLEKFGFIFQRYLCTRIVFRRSYIQDNLSNSRSNTEKYRQLAYSHISSSFYVYKKSSTQIYFYQDWIPIYCHFNSSSCSLFFRIYSVFPK